MIHQWKRALLEGASVVFAGGKCKTPEVGEEQMSDLLANTGGGGAVAEAKADIRTWIEFFNHKRPHTALAANRPL